METFGEMVALKLAYGIVGYAVMTIYGMNRWLEPRTKSEFWSVGLKKLAVITLWPLLLVWLLVKLFAALIREIVKEAKKVIEEYRALPTELVTDASPASLDSHPETAAPSKARRSARRAGKPPSRSGSKG